MSWKQDVMVCEGRCLAEVILRSVAAAKSSGRQLSCGLGSGRNQPFRVSTTEQQLLVLPKTLFLRFPGKLPKTNAREVIVEMQ